MKRKSGWIRAMIAVGLLSVSVVVAQAAYASPAYKDARKIGDRYATFESIVVVEASARRWRGAERIRSMERCAGVGDGVAGLQFDRHGIEFALVEAELALAQPIDVELIPQGGGVPASPRTGLVAKEELNIEHAKRDDHLDNEEDGVHG